MGIRKTINKVLLQVKSFDLKAKVQFDQMYQLVFLTPN
jgi:hypothetical protein